MQNTRIKIRSNLSIYIHIPFCDHKCIYCDFYSIITFENEKNFLSAIKSEIDYFADEYGKGKKILTIFFGGGTPSLVNPSYIRELINHLKERFIIDDNAEITMEANPGTLDYEKLKLYKEFGVNRLSIGIQSFDESELKFLTRIHDKKTAIDTVNLAHKTGFNNINIDLIFNLPGQTKNIWKSNLEHAVSLPVTHISAYSLILERGTILNKMVLDGLVEMGGQDYDADLYDITIDTLEKNNFLQYEVSNFCKPDYKCKHNLVYWNHNEYLGLGPSAHSFINNKRWWNYSSLKQYISCIREHGNAKAGEEQLTKTNMMEEFIMLSLRSEGLNIEVLNKRYGNGWLIDNKDYLDLLVREGYVIHKDNFIKFTKQGYSICDEIIAKFKSLVQSKL